MTYYRMKIVDGPAKTRLGLRPSPFATAEREQDWRDLQDEARIANELQKEGASRDDALAAARRFTQKTRPQR